MPRVAIATAAFIDAPEKDNWLGETIRSIQDQEFTDWEMIIVDDASPIPVPPSGDPRVRLVRASHQQGPGMCRNTAVALARAEAILPLDADDLLASPEVLGTMFDYWERDQASIIYGDMRYLQDDGRLGKVVKFPEYDFQKVLDPKGIIPVTAMHAKACWEAAGGWKPELHMGLEDVEYWIAAGAAGFCGTKIDLVTLIYRRHRESRTSRMRANREEGTARNLIREMHADLYEGRFPVGCCGGSKSRQIAPAQAPPRMTAPPPRDLPPGEAPTEHTTIWVRYNGRRQGEFGMRGPSTGIVYKIAGEGAEFRIYTVDATLFRRSGRGRDFSVGIAPPAQQPEPEPAPAPVQREYTAPQVQMAQILDLDEVARGERGPASQPAPAPSTEQAATPRPAAVQPPPPLVPSQPDSFAAPVEMTPVSGPPRLPTAEELNDAPAGAGLNLDTEMEEVDPATTISMAREQAQDNPLEPLGLGRFQEILEAEGWTIVGLAKADPVELTPYPGIGSVTAANIIKKAQAHLAGRTA